MNDLLSVLAHWKLTPQSVVTCTQYRTSRNRVSFFSSTVLCIYRTGAEAAPESLPSTLGTDINASTPDEDVYVAVEFSLTLPPGFREIPVIPPKPAAPSAGFGTIGEAYPQLLNTNGKLCACNRRATV